jgi:hypothetical protein
LITGRVDTFQQIEWSAGCRNQPVWFEEQATFCGAKFLTVSTERFHFGASHVVGDRKADLAIFRSGGFKIHHAVSVLRFPSRRRFGGKLRSLDRYCLMLIGGWDRQPHSDVRSRFQTDCLAGVFKLEVPQFLIVLQSRSIETAAACDTGLDGVRSDRRARGKEADR